MDLLAACESMAENVAEFDFVDSDEVEISPKTVYKWQNLFGLSYEQASREISNWRADFTRVPVHRFVWNIIKTEKMSLGFDKESYEFSLSRGLSESDPLANSEIDTALYLLKLEEPFPSTSAVQQFMGWDRLPPLLRGSNDINERVQFCSVTSSQKRDIERKAAGRYNITFIRVSIAKKELSPFSLYPTLGIDTTLPQHRWNGRLDSSLAPKQHEYPVSYFFYGTLAQLDVLTRVLGRMVFDGEITYRPARVNGGKLSTWGNKYLGLVDADLNSSVDGHTYLVNSKEDEEALRIYETGQYEVVRCNILYTDDGTSTPGLTFRLI